MTPETAQPGGTQTRREWQLKLEVTGIGAAYHNESVNKMRRNAHSSIREQIKQFNVSSTVAGCIGKLGGGENAVRWRYAMLIHVNMTM